MPAAPYDSTRDEQEPEPAQTDAGNHLHDVGAVVALDERQHAVLPLHQRLAARLAGIYGNVLFVVIEVLLLTAWIVLNSAPLGVRHVDPAPFPLLTLGLTAEVLVLSTCVLVAQRHEAARAERRTQVMLHLDTLVEEKTSLLIRLLTELRAAQGLGEADANVTALQESADVKQVVDALDAASNH